MRPTRSVALAVVLLLGLPARLAAAAPPMGVIVVVGDLPLSPLANAASMVGGASWRAERLKAGVGKPKHAGSGELLKLRQAYFEADFLRCLGMLQRPELSFERLLERGAGGAAAEVGIFAAACAHGAGNLELARQLLERLFTAELDVTATLKLARPDLQRLAEDVRRGFRTRRRVAWLVRTLPAGAEALLDGGVRRCTPTPCSLDVLPGRHVIAIRRLGYATRTIWHDGAAGRTVRASLDEVSGLEALQQLAKAVTRGVDPGLAELGRLGADAFGASVVVLAWRSPLAGHAALFDRRKARVVSRVSVVDSPQAGTHVSVLKAVRATIEEWRGSIAPPPVYKRPLFWGAVVGAAAAAGVIVYLLVRSAQPEYDVVFP